MRGRGSERGGYRGEPEDEDGRRGGISPLPKPVCISGRTRKRGKDRERRRTVGRRERERLAFSVFSGDLGAPGAFNTGECSSSSSSSSTSPGPIAAASLRHVPALN